MLYLIDKRNAIELTYRDGQEPVIHLEADLRQTVDWAEMNNQRWAFTLSNAGSGYFEARCDLAQLTEINWAAVQARDWRTLKEGKQAEFLIEREFSWGLVSRIGVFSNKTRHQLSAVLQSATHQPPIEVISSWYY